MSETELITVGEPLPRLAAVEPANGPTSVSVTWASGSRAGRADVIDLAPMIYTFKVLRPLRDNPALFARVRLGEWGESLVWDDDPDLDIGADALEDLAEETMTNVDFAAFMQRHRLSLDAAAAWLGVSRRLVAYYAKERQIPRPIALASKYLDLVSEMPEERLTAKAGSGTREQEAYASEEVSTRDTARTHQGSFVLTKPGAKRTIVSREKSRGRKP